MRISDIDTIRGDRQNQKPFVAFAPEIRDTPEPPVLVDPAEPYGKDEPKEVVALLELTPAERNLLLGVLDEKRKVCLHAIRESQKGRRTHSRAVHRHQLTVSMIAKLKGN